MFQARDYTEPRPLPPSATTPETTSDPLEEYIETFFFGGMTSARDFLRAFSVSAHTDIQHQERMRIAQS